MSTAASPAGRPTELRGFQRLRRVVKQIFYEFVGAVFGILAFGWANTAFRAWTRDVAPWLILVSVGVALLFVFFSYTSFRRSRSL